MTTSLHTVCKKCGHLETHWENAPRLRQALDIVNAAGRTGVTAELMALRLAGLSYSGACNMLTKLVGMGQITFDPTTRPRVYTKVPRSRRKSADV